MDKRVQIVSFYNKDNMRAILFSYITGISYATLFYAKCALSYYLADDIIHFVVFDFTFALNGRAYEREQM